MLQDSQAVVPGARIVVIGGGTGSFVLLSGLKRYTQHITALVNMSDDGGSTGQLRDELGVLPPGDARQCLVALSDSEKVRDLFNYRFEEGTLKGHAFGNLFLTALEKMTGSFAEAVELAGEVLSITGSVQPVTLSNVTLCMRTADGSVTKGEHKIELAKFGSSRPELWLEPEPKLNPAAKASLEQADMIVIAPGDIYNSLGPALIVPGLGEALCSSKAKKVYVCNLVTKPGQSDGFKAHDFAAEIERFIGQPCLDYMLYNRKLPSDELLEKYAHEGEFAVEIDDEALQNAHYEAKGAALIANGISEEPSSADAIAHMRSYIRHDPDLIARELMRLYFS